VGFGVKLMLETDLRRFHISFPCASVGPWLWAPAAAACIQLTTCGAKQVLPVGPKCYDGELSIFCDASFRPHSREGGIGIYIPAFKVGLARGMCAVPSSCLAELVAISVALDQGLDMCVPRFVVWSDSQVALRTLESRLRSFDITQLLVLEIGLKLFKALSSGILVRVGWVQGHSGVLGNEEADRLARSAVGGSEMCLSFSARELVPIIHGVMRGWWEDQWAAEVTGRELFTIHPTVSFPRELAFFSRVDASLLSRLRTGHILLNGHAYEMGLVPSPSCECGSAWESVDHFLCECPRHAVHRGVLYAVMGPVLDVSHLLGARPHAKGSRMRHLRAVLNFCRATKRLSR